MTDASRAPLPRPAARPAGRAATWTRVARAMTAGALALTLAASSASRAGAQGRGVEIRLPTRAALASEGPLVRLVGVLNERDLRDLLDHGFPIRLHYRAELWTVAGWFNDLRGSWEWDVVVQQNAMARTYEVVRLVGDEVTPLGEFSQLSAAVTAAERPYRVPLLPPRGRRSYWNLVVDVETLSMSDLDEVERWLRGELRPAVRGRRNPGTAVGRGLKTLASRLLGGETRHYEVRSETFRP
ncbi:MAG: hypothetical protein ACXWZ4_08795 [Gemmatirosa sp.]